MKIINKEILEPFFRAKVKTEPVVFGLVYMEHKIKVVLLYVP